MSLQDFISTHREEIIERARAKVASRNAPLATSHELLNGVPLFLTQLGSILEQEAARSLPDGLEMGKSATQHGGDLLQQGFSIAQVVHDYGDVCQAVTELAVELRVPIATEDFQTLNRCLDNAIASAVTEYSRERGQNASEAEARRQGFFAHELRNRLSAAMLAFQVVKTGRVGVSGSTIEVLERSLQGLRDLINRSVSEVRLSAGAHLREKLHLAQFIEEVEIDASLEASNRGIQFRVEPVDADLLVNVDRHLFTSAIANLLQNAFKFTRPSSRVCLRTRATEDHVLIEVEDQCGGLPPGAAEAIFQPFEQWGADREGLGLGLAISRQAIEANGGTISLRDMPGEGCVFVVEVPRTFADSKRSARPVPATSRS
jgi:signal transduction histidine kinase